MISKSLALCALAAISFSGGAAAVPVRVSASQFATALASTTATVEDFEGIASGAKPASFALSNFTFKSNATAVGNVSFLLPTNSLYNNAPEPAAGRIFDSFANDTTLFGLTLGGVDALDVLDIFIVGGSGSVEIKQTLGSFAGFAGFQDLLGLSSVTFHDLGHGLSTSNYAFDNVTTGESISVPIPASISLVAAGMFGLLVNRRARHKPSV